MVTFALTGVLIGAAIGLRFRVLALLPIELVGLACLLIALFLTSPGAAVLTFFVWSCALQMGYLITACIGARQQPAPSRSLASQH